MAKHQSPQNPKNATADLAFAVRQELQELATQLEAIADVVQGALKTASIEAISDRGWRSMVRATKIAVRAFDLGITEICPRLDSIRRYLPKHMLTPKGTILPEGYQRMWFFIAGHNPPQDREPPLMPDDGATEEARCRLANVTLMSVCREIAKTLKRHAQTTTSAPPVQFVDTDLQTRILKELDGVMLTGDELSRRLGVDRSNLYETDRKKRTGGLTELKDHGRVMLKRGGGYYRTDSLPQT